LGSRAAPAARGNSLYLIVKQLMHGLANFARIQLQLLPIVNTLEMQLFVSTARNYELRWATSGIEKSQNYLEK